jgi:hypothetical protein
LSSALDSRPEELSGIVVAVGVRLVF